MLGDRCHPRAAAKRDRPLRRPRGLGEVVLGHVGADDEVLAVELDRGQAGGTGEVDRPAQVVSRPRRWSALEQAQGTAVGEHEQPHVGVEVGGQVRGPDVLDELAGPCAPSRSDASRARCSAAARRSDVIRGSEPSSGIRASAARASSAAATSPSSTASEGPVHAGPRAATGRSRGRAETAWCTASTEPASSRPRPCARSTCLDEVRVPGRRGVLEGRRRAVALEEPPRGDAVQPGGLVGGPPAERGGEVGAHQRVVAEPRAAAVEPASSKALRWARSSSTAAASVATGQEHGELDRRARRRPRCAGGSRRPPPAGARGPHR